ncbi:MAG TPA: TonB-dependent receptor [Burkholderiaceae bacterium]
MRSFTVVSAPLALAASLVCAQAIALDDVVVTATRAEQDIARTLADATVIDAGEIERAGASTLPELLRTAGGVEILQNGGAGSTSGIFVRGTKTSQTVVLVDGVRLENATSGTANLEFIPLSSIERIEIVRGPLSSLYGSGAIGGVIQIFTRKGSGAPQPWFSLAAGTRSTSQLRAGFSGEARGTGFSIALARDRTAGHDATLPGNFSRQDDRDGNAVRSVNGSLRHALPNGWSFGARVLASSGDARYDDPFSTPEDARYRYRTNALSAFARGRPAPRWQTELRLGETRIDYRFDAYGFAPRTATRTTSWENWFDLPSGRLLLGAEQLRQRIAGEGVTSGPFVYDTDARRTESVFAGYEVGIDRHLVRVQLRHDEIRGVASEPSATLAWGYQLAHRWLVRASVASAFRVPTFDDLYNPFGSNPALMPERSRGAEVAIEYRERATSAKATLFASRIRDAIELDQNFVPQNLQDARVRGLTLEARHRAGDWHARASVTLQDPRAERDDGSVTPLALRARRHAALSLDWAPGPMRVGLEWLAQGDRVDAGGNRIAGYGVLGLNGAYTLATHWELFARLTNLGNKAYQSGFLYAMPPRALLVGLRYQPK